MPATTPSMTSLSALPRANPTGRTASATNANGRSNSSQALQDNFMRILMAQLQYQDPMKPMENAEMTSQLAQLSGLEQQQQGNSLLQRLLDSRNADGMGQAVSYLGHSVVQEGNHMDISNGRGTLFFELSDASDATIAIFDSQGSRVKDLPSAHYEAGVRSVDVSDTALRNGTYTFTVTPRTPTPVPGLPASAQPTAPTVTLLQQGRVDSVVREGSQIILNVGDLQTPLDQVRRVA